MNSVRDLLRDADPLRHEPHDLGTERDRIRQAILAVASDVAVPSSAWFHTRAALAATVALTVCILAVASQIWSRGGTALQAAVRFEVRLAEDGPTAGLQAARVGGSDRMVYLHEEIVVTNGDIAERRVVQGDDPSRFGVSVELNGAGSERMRQATVNHIGKPVAILIDGEVVAAPVLRGPISTLAVISGDYTKAEAERIVNGIGIR